MQITDKKEIAEISKNFEELNDGLVVVLSAGEVVLDAYRVSNKDSEHFIVETFERVEGKKEEYGINNISFLSKCKQVDYEMVERVCFTKSAEMHSYIHMKTVQHASIDF